MVVPADGLRHLVFLGVGFQAGIAGFHQEPQGLAHHHALPLVASTAGIQVVHPIFPAVGQIIKPAHGLWDACAGLLVVVLGDGDLPGVRVGGPGGLDGIIPHVRGRGDGAEFMLHMVPPLLGRLEFRWPGGGGGVLRPPAAKRARCRAAPGSGRVGGAHPPPPPRPANEKSAGTSVPAPQLDTISIAAKKGRFNSRFQAAFRRKRAVLLPRPTLCPAGKGIRP